jgi:hypothetical protein
MLWHCANTRLRDADDPAGVGLLVPLPVHRCVPPSALDCYSAINTGRSPACCNVHACMRIAGLHINDLIAIYILVNLLLTHCLTVMQNDVLSI